MLAMLLPLEAFGWTAPIGIPTPSWPSDLDIARPTMPSPWTSDQAGWYFIQSSGCSDTGRTYGNPSAPRCTMPTAPSAGAKIVLNGTISGDKSLTGSGSAGSEIWYMAYNTGSKPTITGAWDLTGSYTILDSLAFSASLQDGTLGLGGNRNMVRDCTFSNTYTSSNGSTISFYGDYNVYYRNTMTASGNWQYEGEDVDRHGIKVDGDPTYAWIVDSTFYHCQGDAVQVGDQNSVKTAIHHIYIGRNTAYENLQGGFWHKKAQDVIMSQNTVYNMTISSDSGPGYGLGGQYDSDRIWFIFNYVYNCNTGIHSMGEGSGYYVIGNVIRDGPYSGDWGVGYRGGYSARSGSSEYVLNNTFYNNQEHITTDIAATIMYNIFGGSSYPSSYYAAIMENSSATVNYNIWSNSAWDIEWNTIGYTTVTAWKTASGKEANGYIQDPSFASTTGSNFSLNSDSIAINHGGKHSVYDTFYSTYGVSIAYDFAGNARPATSADWDIGAYEYISGGDTTAPTIDSITTSDPSSITSDSLSVTGTASDAVWGSGSVCKWRIGSAPDASNGTDCTGTTEWTCATSGYVRGSNTLYVGCTDAAANWGAGDSITVNYLPVIQGISAVQGLSIR